MEPDDFFDYFLYESEPGTRAVANGPCATWRLWWRIQARKLADTELGRLATAQGFVATTAQLYAHGVSPRRIRTFVARGT